MTDDDLAARLQQLEDERDIARLIASYGPAVDAGDPDATAGLWATDGVYDVEGWRMESRADVHAMVASSSHQNLVAGGSCHFLGPCVVTVTGDSAAAVCESLVLLRDGDGYRVWRATANHFALRRIDDGGFFVREVVEERARRNSGFDADVLDGHLVPAAFLCQVHRGAADIRAGLVRRRSRRPI